MKKIAAAILVSMIFISCTMRNEINLETDGSGTANVEINLKSFVLPTIEDLAEISPDVDPDELLDPDRIREQLMENPEISNVKVIRPLKNRLNMDFEFGSVEDLFSQTEEDVQTSGLIKIQETAEGTKLTLTVNKETYRGFSHLIPNLDDPTMSALAPDPDMVIEESDYLDMIEFFFGEEGPEGILTSDLEMVINVNGMVLEQKGGAKIDNDTVVFSVPLIRVLLLDQNLVYSLTYK